VVVSAVVVEDFLHPASVATATANTSRNRIDDPLKVR
jgi:hypothetical protein